MDSLQWTLEQLFCPPIDSTLIAAIVSDNSDFDTCFDILSSLAEEANSVLDAEVGKEILIENESSSGNSSNNFRNSSVPSFEPGDGSTTSLEYGLSVEDELDYASTCSTTNHDKCDFEHPEGNAEFLKNMFPTLTGVKVDTLLRENNNDVEMVLDVILNETYLETEQQGNDFPYLHSTSPLIPVRDSNYDGDNSLVSEPRFKHRKKKRQKQKIIFQNNGHRPNSLSLNSSATTSTSPSATSSCWSKNPWNRFGYESQDELLDDNKLSQLVSLFPSHNFESLKQALITCDGDVQNAIDVLLPADGKQDKNTKRKSYMSEHISHQIVHNKERNNTIGSKSYVRTSSSLTNMKIYDDDNNNDGYEDDYDPKHCQDQVFQCLKKRHEYFKKAAQSHRKGDGATASYYSDEGWKCDAEMKRWKLRAARSLVKKHSEKKQDEYVLDLHGCFVNEALIIVKEWLNDWNQKRMRSVTLKPLKIITGKGNHSPNGEAKLPNAINSFLIKDWNITKDKGYVLVHGLK